LFVEVVLIISAALAAVFVFMLLKAAYMPTRQMAPGKAQETPGFDIERASGRLASALRFRTVNGGVHDEGAKTEFLKLHEHLRNSYPNVFSKAEVSVHGGYSLLVRLRGKDASLKPVIFMGHMDVVPVEESSADRWLNPAFGGTINEGFIWGRGALDCKHVVLGLLEALEELLNSGYEPLRGIYLAFGHDEETGGAEGAAAIGAFLESEGTKAWMVLDEGGRVDDPGHLTGKPLEAVISIGEKGYASFRLEVDMPGGHSARPPRENAISVLIKAADKVNSHSFSPRIEGPVSDLLSFAGTEMGFWKRLAIANMWIAKPFVVGWLASSPSTNCLMRTTAVTTILKAGMKDNVIPSHAEAIVNTRPAFGETPESVRCELERAIADKRVKIVASGHQHTPSSASPVDCDQFRLLQKVIAGHFEDPVVIPGILTGGTDTKHYANLSDAVYRFIPVRLSHELAEGVHGINERIPVDEYGRMIGFYMEIMKEASS